MPFVRPASVHRFDGSLTMVFWLIIFFTRMTVSLIGILTFGRCTVAIGAIGCLLAFTLSMLCLIMSFFSAYARMALYRKTAFSVAGSMLRLLPLQLLQSSSLNTPSPRLVSWTLKSVWSDYRCCTSSVNVMALSKSGFMLYPLGLTTFALNSGESQTGDSCWKSLKRTTERFPNGLSL